MGNWVIIAEWGTKAVFAVLVGLSIWSVAVMIDRLQTLNKFDRIKDLEEAKELILNKKWTELKAWVGANEGLLPLVLKAALDFGSAEDSIVDRRVRSLMVEERLRLEKGFTVLATLGANAAFVGLFRTVLGIIQAFAVLAANQTGPAAVMASVSEALIATAVGLFVAIPAVVAYNYFSRRLKLLLLRCESARDFYLAYRK